MFVEKVARAVLDSAFAVHKELGPGLLETAYEACLMEELVRKGYKAECQVPLPVIYKEKKLEAGFRIDLLVERTVLVELKSVDAIAPIHLAQVITYLRLAHLQLGFLINFNEVLLKNGIRRVVNDYRGG